MCGAAVSVAVESQEWAANFYAEGGTPSTVIKSAITLDETEAANLLEQWMDKPHNVPRVIDPNIEEITEHGVNVQGAQMLEAREYQNGDVARMFGIPGSLLDYRASGSNLTYQNIEQEFTKFLTACLLPGYLDKIQQEMDDLLPRSTVGRFNVDALRQADIKTRYEVYEKGIGSGVLTPEEARKKEGLDAGDVENAPIPFSPPAATIAPSQIPLQLRAVEVDGGPVRCTGRFVLRGRLTTCNKKLADKAPFTGTCRRCKASYAAA